MGAFALSCVAILLYLWLTFGGAVPLRSEGYRFTIKFPEATQLAQEADVRISGVNVGKVKTKKPDNETGLTSAVLELQSQYAPIPKDTRAILRQKTLLGETYVELSPGNRDAPPLNDGGTLSTAQVAPTVELDEIFRAFDPKTRRAFTTWLDAQGRGVEKGGADLNRALAAADPVRRGRGRRAAHPAPPGRRHARPGARHGRGVQRAQRAPRPAAGPDHELQPGVRDHGRARPPAGRHLRGLPDLPARGAHHHPAADHVRPGHRPAGDPAATRRARALADAAERAGHRARPARPVHRPGPADQGLAQGPARAGRHPGRQPRRCWPGSSPTCARCSPRSTTWACTSARSPRCWATPPEPRRRWTPAPTPAS